MKSELAADRELVFKALDDVKEAGEGAVRVVVADGVIVSITKEIRVYTRTNPTKRRRKNH